MESFPSHFVAMKSLLIIALFHFVTGRELNPPYPFLWHQPIPGRPNPRSSNERQHDRQHLPFGGPIPQWGRSDKVQFAMNIQNLTFVPKVERQTTPFGGPIPQWGKMENSRQYTPWGGPIPQWGRTQNKVPFRLFPKKYLMEIRQKYIFLILWTKSPIFR